MGTNLFDGVTFFTDTSDNLNQIYALGVAGTTDNVNWLRYGELIFSVPSLISGFPPLFQTPATNTLDTNATAIGAADANEGYAGYTNYQYFLSSDEFNLFNPDFPTLDRTNGFSFSFNVAIASEASNANRAGFSIMAISSDGMGIELGFKEEGATDRIFAQSADFIESEDANTDINTATDYVLTVWENNYTLSVGGTEILTGDLRSYNFDPEISYPPLPFNPYTTPSFLFLGDDTDQGNANFTLGTISVNNFPVAIDDSNYSTDEDVALTVAAEGLVSNDTDGDDDPLTATLVTDSDNGGSVVVNPEGSFTYTPPANFSGTDTFTYRVNDGTNDSQNDATVTISVNAVADAPTLVANEATGNEDEAISLDITSSLTDTDGSETLSITISGVPTGATLSAGTDNGSGNWTLTSAQLAGLTISPSANSNDDLQLTVTATATETSNNNTASISDTLNVTINPVNDAPTFSKGSDQTVSQDAGAQTVTSWATEIATGGGDDESTQEITFNVTNDNNSLFTVQPAINSSGTLSFTPSANASGTATISVALTDDGGTDNGGEDTSSIQSFTITVNPVVTDDAADGAADGGVDEVSDGAADDAADGAADDAADGAADEVSDGGTDNELFPRPPLGMTSVSPLSPLPTDNNIEIFLSDYIPTSSVGDGIHESFYLMDLIYNGEDNLDDNITGGELNQAIASLAGNDFIRAMEGNDSIEGGEGNDTLNGNQGDDFVDGGLGNDSLHGGKNNDTVNGASGNDIVRGDLGDDILDGWQGDDFLNGNQGNDWVDGGDGDDSLHGGKDDDTLIGGIGDDWLFGDLGNDLLIGGNGEDIFVLSIGRGSDAIADFTDNIDKIGLAGGLTFDQLNILSSNNHTLIKVGGELLVTLYNIDANQIASDDFMSVE